MLASPARLAVNYATHHLAYMLNLQHPTLIVLLLAIASPVAIVGQIPDVSPLCADRPPVRGSGPLLTSITENPSRTGTRQDRPASDLVCIDLFSTANGGDALGVIELTRPWSPFGVTVTPEGHHRHQLRSWISGLPNPSSLGPYQTYIAWATPLELDPVIKLGPVSNGENNIKT